ncbi:hypothetical protein FACS189474_3900 [Bacteroidia bacterium]|nr:hypothetical protein FACS189474_3900 [Bacteroidia bacterium]
MKYYLFTALLFLSFVSIAQIIPPPNAGGGLPKTTDIDEFRLKLNDNSGALPDSIYLYTHTRAKAEFLGPLDTELNDGNEKFKFGSVAYETSKSGKVVAKILFIDRRGVGEYDINYYVDYPLSMQLPASADKEYTFSVSYSSEKNKAAVAFRLIDSLDPDSLIILSEQPYKFKSQAGEASGSKRFTARIYAVNLLKQTTDEEEIKVWTNADNWYGGVPGVPREGNNPINNRSVLIPANTKVEIPAGAAISINTLLNSGELFIRENAELTVDYEAQLAAFAEMY